MNAFKKKKRWHCLSGQEPTEMDKTIMYWENKGKLVPTRELIKTPEQIEGIRKAGVVNTGVLDEVAKQIHAGMNTLEIDQICRQYCEDHGAIPACLNYEGFPMSVCTSINEVVCHGIPKEEDVLEEGDIINVDFTTILDGYYADASRMYILTTLVIIPFLIESAVIPVSQADFRRTMRDQRKASCLVAHAPQGASVERSASHRAYDGKIATASRD